MRVREKEKEKKKIKLEKESPFVAVSGKNIQLIQDVE
jgi:hypothetical protein